MTKPELTCEVCERKAPAKTHPCRFERGCACWRGIPCGPESRGPDSWARTERISSTARPPINPPTAHDLSTTYRDEMRAAGRHL